MGDALAFVRRALRGSLIAGTIAVAGASVHCSKECTLEDCRSGADIEIHVQRTLDELADASIRLCRGATCIEKPSSLRPERIEKAIEPAVRHGGCTMCRPKLDDVLVTVVIEEAEGGPAPYPDMVTPNYRRHYRIEVDTGALSADECEGLNVSLALRFEQTAAQFVNDPHGACVPCH